jgi:hypothetical protein
MLYREIIAVCSEIHTKHINTLCGQTVALLNVKLAVHTVTAGFQGANECPPLLPICSQPQLIAKYEYPVQTHSVQTADGYILELHRIPHGTSGPANWTRPAVLMHHALLCSSFDWVGLGPERSLGMSSISWRLCVRLVPVCVPFHTSLQTCDAVPRSEWLLTRGSHTSNGTVTSSNLAFVLYSFLIVFFPSFCISLFVFHFIAPSVSPISVYFVFSFFLHHPVLQLVTATHGSVHLCLSAIRQDSPGRLADLRYTFASTKQ